MRLYLAILPLLTPLAHGQMNKAEATLHVRSVEDHIEAAIEIEIDRGWHLYHHDLGDDPHAVGKPTTIQFLMDGEESDEVLWSDLVWPEPHLATQAGLGPDGSDAKILEHTGTITLYAVGQAEDEVDLEALTVKLSGLTCQDDGVCIPYGEEIEVDGEGAADTWEAFPEELLSEESGNNGHTRGKLYVRHGDNETRAVIVLDIEDHWHIFDPDIGDGHGLGQPSTITLDGNNLTWGLQHWPKPYVLVQEGLGPKDKATGEFTDAWIRAHEGKVVIRTSALIAPDTTPGAISASLIGQECQTGGMCIPLELEFSSSGKGPDEYFAEPFPPYVSKDTEGAAAAGVESEDKAGLSLWAFLLLAVGAGLFTLLMPCTYPMIPITISFFTKQADQRDGKVLPLSLAYGSGIVLIFVLIGVVVGPVIVNFAVHWATNLIIGVMFVFFAMTLFGFVDLQPPRFLMNAASKASMKGGFVGVFLMGATLVVTSFTCTAPFVGSLLSVGASTGDRDLTRVALGMGVFGLTMAIPFVMLSLLPGKVKQMPQSGMWMKTLKVTLGFVELAAALKFLSNFELALNWKILPNHIFLPIWIVIFVAASLYLFGLFEKGVKVTNKRRLAGVGFLALAGYWGLGTASAITGSEGGVKLDWVSQAMISPYGKLTPKEDREIIKDDYPAALASAREQGKFLLVNFTGFL